MDTSNAGHDRSISFSSSDDDGGETTLYTFLGIGSIFYSRCAVAWCTPKPKRNLACLRIAGSLKQRPESTAGVNQVRAEEISILEPCRKGEGCTH